MHNTLYSRLKTIGALTCSLFTSVALTSCGDWFDYHPYDVKLSGPRDINIKNCNTIERLCQGKANLRIALFGDTQGWYDETELLVSELNRRDDIDFAIHTGDISDYGMTQEFEWQASILNRLNVPYVAVIGNHDCLATGRQTFGKVFGPLNYSFIAGDVKFICLNTNALEFDYSVPIPDFDFLVHEMTDTTGGWERVVMVMHAPPGCDVFNNNILGVWKFMQQQMDNLMFCINGHCHMAGVYDYLDDGVMYYQTANIEKRSYIVMDINEEEYSYEIVEF